MAWIESHQTLSAHPKTRKLAMILGVSKPAAIGHLHCLWWWATDYAEDGSLARFDVVDIAIGAEWDGDADAFVDALVRAGFVDLDATGALVIHDWHDYAGKLIERRKANAERMRKARAERETSTNDAREDTSTSRAAHVQRTQRARAERPDRTRPNQTEPDQGDDSPPPPPVAGAEPEPTDAKPRTARQQVSDARHERRVALYGAWCVAVGLDPDGAEATVGRDVAFRQLKPLVDQAEPTAEDFGACTVYLASQSWRDDPPSIPQVIQGYGRWVGQGRPKRASARAPADRDQPPRRRNGGMTPEEIALRAKELRAQGR